MELLLVLEDALSERGFTCLRFNFRGVGRSGGSREDGREVEDALAASAALADLLRPGAFMAWVGWSFGAAVALGAALRTTPQALALLSLPLTGLPQGLVPSPPPDLSAVQGFKLLLAGDSDPWAPREALEDLRSRLPPPAEIVQIPGADHFFFGRETEVAQAVSEKLAAIAEKRTRSAVPPEWVGKRVSLRFLLPEGGVSEAVGTLTSHEGALLTLETRKGRIEVPISCVTHARPLDPGRGHGPDGAGP